MNRWLHYLPIQDKENAGPRIIIFSVLLFSISVLLFISNINFLLDSATPLVVNISNFIVWAIILVAFFYTKTEKRMEIITPVILIISTAVLFGGLSITGGLFSVDNSWAIIMILVAYLFSGIRSGVLFTLLSFAGISIYYYGEKNSIWSHSTIQLIRDADYAYSTMACVLITLSVVLFAFVKTLNSLQKKNRELTEARFDELKMMLESRSREIDTLRNKLARDFHDQTGNKLVTLKMLAAILRNHSEKFPDDLSEKINLIEKNANDLYAHTRDFIWSIDSRNSSLDEIMLHLNDFGNSFYSPMEIDFNSEGDLKELRKYSIPVEHVMQLILIFKEAMTNAGKYGNCKNICLSFQSVDNHCSIILKDDGKGFNKNSIARKSGLLNMEERSKQIGASIAINSSSIQGTSISLQYPILAKTIETSVFTL